MVLNFLSVLLALYTQSILYFALPDIKFQSLEDEHLPYEEANLDTRIMVKLLLYLHLCSTKLSISVPFICIFGIGLWSFRKVCQNIYFYGLFWKFCFIYWCCSVIESNMVFNNNRHQVFKLFCVGFSSVLTGNSWTKFDIEACQKPPKVSPNRKRVTLPVPCWSVFISPLSVIATPSPFSRRLGPSVKIIFRGKNTLSCLQSLFRWPSVPQ